MTVRWGPDTCSCVFNVADDWLSGEPEQLCPLHQSVNKPFEAALGRNKTKNITLNKAAELAPDLVITTSMDDNDNVKVKVHGKKPTDTPSEGTRFAHNPEPATAAEKTKLKDDLKAHFGKDIDVS